MTEVEWLASEDPAPMLAFVYRRASDRKRQLLSVACCRRASQHFAASGWGEQWRQVVDSVEGFADGKVTIDELKRAVNFSVLAWVRIEELRELTYTLFPDEHSHQADLLRDIFGNPFRPVTADPAWLTPTVLSLTHGIYADRVFDRLPILADAFQDAGCDHPDILAHCQGDGPHVRGCWVVDLVLGKE